MEEKIKPEKKGFFSKIFGWFILSVFLSIYYLKFFNNILLNIIISIKVYNIKANSKVLIWGIEKLKKSRKKDLRMNSNYNFRKRRDDRPYQSNLPPRKKTYQ